MEKETFNVSLAGLSDIMFDKFIDQSKEIRPVEQKLYLAEGNKLVFPAMNIFAFLFNEKVGGIVKMIEGKRSREYLMVGKSHVVITPILIPFLDGKGKEIIIKSTIEKDERFHIFPGSPTTKGPGGSNIKQESKNRPVLKLPWKLNFQTTLLENRLIKSEKLENWFNEGGLIIALGTYRPIFGRFMVEKWERL